MRFHMSLTTTNCENSNLYLSNSKYLKDLVLEYNIIELLDLVSALITSEFSDK